MHVCIHVVAFYYGLECDISMKVVMGSAFHNNISIYHMARVHDLGIL